MPTLIPNTKKKGKEKKKVTYDCQEQARRPVLHLHTLSTWLRKSRAGQASTQRFPAELLLAPQEPRFGELKFTYRTSASDDHTTKAAMGLVLRDAQLEPEM